MTAPALGRELSLMAAIMALAPLFAPLIGGVLQTAVRLAVEFRRAVLLRRDGRRCMVWLLLPETLRQRAPEPVSPMSIAAVLSPLSRRSRFRRLSRHRDLLHVRPVRLDLRRRPSCSRTSTACRRWPSASRSRSARAGYLLGTIIAARFVMRWGSGRTMGFGAWRMAAGGLAMVAGRRVRLHAAMALGADRSALYMVGMGMVLAAGAGRRAACRFRIAPARPRRCSASCTQTSSAIVGAILGHMLGEHGLAARDCGCARRLLRAAVVGADARPARGRGAHH